MKELQAAAQKHISERKSELLDKLTLEADRLNGLRYANRPGAIDKLRKKIRAMGEICPQVAKDYSESIGLR
jgi:hypothetical protein